MPISESDLRQRGIRLTPQRRMILDAIQKSPGHVTAEDIHQQVLRVYPYMNISTVYRTLETLRDLHLVTVTDLGAGRLCFEVLGSDRHHHLVCHNCGTVIEFQDDFLAGLKTDIEREYGFAPDLDHLAIWGLCPRCRKGGRQEDEHAHP